MREAPATPRARAVPRAPGTSERDGALDDVSDQLGEVLRHADALLAEWARFAAQARAQVDRQVESLGDAVGAAIGGAVDRAAERAGASVDAATGRAIEARIGAQLASLSAEIARLEQRARAATRLIADERGRERKLMWGIVAGIGLANLLLAIVLLRGPSTVPAPAPAPAPPVDVPAEPVEAVDDPGPGAPGAVVPAADPGAGTADDTPAAAAGSGVLLDEDAAAATGSGADPGAGSAAPGNTKPVRAGTVPRYKPRKK